MCLQLEALSHEVQAVVNHPGGILLLAEHLVIPFKALHAHAVKPAEDIGSWCRQTLRHHWRIVRFSRQVQGVLNALPLATALQAKDLGSNVG